MYVRIESALRRGSRRPGRRGTAGAHMQSDLPIGTAVARAVAASGVLRPISLTAQVSLVF